MAAMIEHIAEQQIATEVDCVKKVLAQWLGREPTNEDASKTKRLFNQGLPGVYEFVYDNTSLGLISKHNDGDRFSCTFTPHSLNSE